jgi:hypothetical protein
MYTKILSSVKFLQTIPTRKHKLQDICTWIQLTIKRNLKETLSVGKESKYVILKDMSVHSRL